MAGGGKTLEGMADGLVTETLVEAASTFFGARKALEDEIELYRRRTEELERAEAEVLRRAAALHSLLPDAAAVRGFYAALGVDPGPLPEAAAGAAPAREAVRAPFSLLPWRRYAGLLLAAYAALPRPPRPICTAATPRAPGAARSRPPTSGNCATGAARSTRASKP
jgi:hypothetical protein